MPEGWFTGEAGSSGGGPPVFDNAATVANNAFNQLLSWTLTVGTAANRLVVLCVGAGAGSTTQTANTLGGTPFTRLGRVFDSSNVYIDVWYLLNPASGSQTFHYNTDSGVHMSGVCITYSNVNQVTPFGTTGSAHSTAATSDTTTISAAVTDLVLSAMFIFDNAGPSVVSHGAGQTVRGDIVTASQIRTVATEQAGASSVTSSFSWTGSDPTGQLSVPIHGASASVFEGWA